MRKIKTETVCDTIKLDKIICLFCPVAKVMKNRNFIEISFC